MMNYVWFGLMAVALIVAAFNGTAEGVTKGAIDAAKTAVEISIGLVGVMAMWLGIMRIAEKAGLIASLAKVIAPVIRLLFPGVPRGHRANGSIVMNLAANMLGVSNAATPLGIKAMEDLQELNPDQETASDDQVMFMSLNTASVQLVPATMIGVMAAAGANDPTAIVGSTLVATLIGTVAAIIVTKLLQPFFRKRQRVDAPDEVEG